MSKTAQRRHALLEATASLRLEGLPISQLDDDLYAATIDGQRVGQMRDLVLMRIRAELASKTRPAPR